MGCEVYCSPSLNLNGSWDGFTLSCPPSMRGIKGEVFKPARLLKPRRFLKDNPNLPLSIFYPLSRFFVSGRFVAGFSVLLLYCQRSPACPFGYRDTETPSNRAQNRYSTKPALNRHFLSNTKIHFPKIIKPLCIKGFMKSAKNRTN